jgi:hypothetical protein
MGHPFQDWKFVRMAVTSPDIQPSVHTATVPGYLPHIQQLVQSAVAILCNHPMATVAIR